MWAFLEPRRGGPDNDGIDAKVASVSHASARVSDPVGPGLVVGERYRIVRELGGGGMGTVYEAEHIRLERPFALKVLRGDVWTVEAVQRFEREARALGKVRSDRVAQVTDYGVEAGVGPYYVMELVEGQTLRDRLDRKGVLPPLEVARVGADIAKAVADVHEAGVVHRDLKPANIGLPDRGSVLAKILDFGLAGSADDVVLARLTKTRQVVGSLPYIAPEQFSGIRPSRPQDIWALGVVLYEMCAARLPFVGSTAAAMMHEILVCPPDLNIVPPQLRPVLEQLLQKDPGERFPSAASVAQELERVGRVSSGSVELQRTHISDHGALAAAVEAAYISDHAALAPMAALEAAPISDQAALAPTVALESAPIGDHRVPAPTVAMEAVHVRKETGLPATAAYETPRLPRTVSGMRRASSVPGHSRRIALALLLAGVVSSVALFWWIRASGAPTGPLPPVESPAVQSASGVASTAAAMTPSASLVATGHERSSSAAPDLSSKMRASLADAHAAPGVVEASAAARVEQAMMSMVVRRSHARRSSAEVRRQVDRTPANGLETPTAEEQPTVPAAPVLESPPSSAMEPEPWNGTIIR